MLTSSSSKMSGTPNLHEDLHYLIAKYLSHGPCQRAGQVLIEELEQNKMIPHRLNWLGETFKQDFKTYDSKLNHISPDHLVKLMEKLMDDSDKAAKSDGVSSNKGCSILATKLNNLTSPLNQSRGTRLFLKSPIVNMSRLNSGNSVQSLFGREFTGRMTSDILKPSMISERLHRACKTLGHLTAAYCVLVDMSGKYIFTGADDKLVKIWSLDDGRLLFTLRGSTSEITDLAINHENTLLATSCNEKLIRVWCLRTGVQLATLNAHSGSVTSVFFCPIPRSHSTIRYLASTASDGSCAFWAYQEEPGCKAVFNDKPTMYHERMRPGQCKMLCSSFSPGGVFMAAGSADNNVRVYYMLGAEGPERILEVESHSDKVDSISWAHKGLRFISGSRDGTALVWRFERQQWLFVRIQSSNGDADIPIDPKFRNKVTMVAWNADDSLVLTAVSNHTIKVWNPANGDLVRILGGHTDESYCVEANPTNPRIVCTAGHDGQLFVWDIGTVNDSDLHGGKMLYSIRNDLADGQGVAAIFDVKWSPDGLSLAATDSYGYLSIFNSSQNEKFHKLPENMFFHTDYRPVVRDAITNVIYDEQTQMEPHLMPPPFLVDGEGNPYPPEFQRLVPGREKCEDREQLIPNVAVFPEGFQVVIEGAPPVPAAPPRGNPRSNIEQLIEQLAAEQQGLVNVENNENQEMNADRRSGENGSEGGRSRQVSGEWQAAGPSDPVPQQPKTRTIVQKLSPGELAMSEKNRQAHCDDEDTYYQDEKAKSPLHDSTALTFEERQARLTRQDERLAREIRSRRIRQLAARAAEERRQAEINEVQHNAREGVARPNPPQREYSMPQAPRRRNNIVQVSGQRRRRRARYTIRVPVNEHGAVQSDHESSRSESSFTGDDVTSTSSSESEFSDSDWGGGPSTVSPKKSSNTTGTTSERRRPRNTASASPPEVKQENESESDADYAEPQPGPSSSMMKSKAEPHKPRPARRAKRTTGDVGALEEIEEIYRPSEWLSELMPKKSPYFPQLGDDLIYFRQGHQLYIEEVKKSTTYPLSKKYLKSLPWCTHPSLPTEVPVRVVGIKFEIRPPRLCTLKLAITDLETGELTGSNINNVTYHDVSNIVDFLVLRQVYDKAMRHRWNVGDRFRSLIDRVWWIGSINSVGAFHTTFPDSQFLCYSATWSNGDVERMSPWDLEVIPDDFEIPETETKDEGIPASEEDLHSDLYEVNARDWPPFGHQEVECQRIAALFEQVMGLGAAENFLTPVDLNKYPEYVYEIAYPVDLNTIKTRLQNRFYRRLDALKFDIKHIALNAEQFNRPMTDIVKKARIIRDLCLQISCQPELTEVTGMYHTLSNNFKWEKTDAPSTPSKSRPAAGHAKNSADEVDKNSVNGRTSSKLRPRNNFNRRSGRSNGESSKSWPESCRELLEKLWQSRDSEPFRKAVDPTEYPDYYRQIDTPMDLQSVKEDLLGGNYATPHEFARDMRLIFSNSRAFNTDKHSRIHIMTIRLGSAFECQMGPILDDYKHRRYRSSRRKDEKFITATPTKAGSSRALRNAERSSQLTPRKNPRRTAAIRNPYVHSEGSNESSGEEEPVADGDQYRDHRRKKRRRSGQQPTSARKRSGTRQVRSSHDDSISPQTARAPRAVKRLRINSSGDSAAGGPMSASPVRQGPSSRNARSSRFRGGTPRKVPKVEPGSEEHNFEESEGEIPQLSKQPDESESDYEEANQEELHENRRRRSQRRIEPVETISSRGRHRPRKNYREDDDDSENEGARKTRFRGRRIANYQEPGSAEEEQMEPVEEKLTLTLADRVKQSRRNSHSSSNGAGKRGQSGSNRAHTSEEEEDVGEEEEEGEEEELGDEEAEDNEQPGPSSRLRPVAVKGYHLLRSNPRVKEEEQDYVEEEHDEDEQEDDDDDEDYSEHEDNSNRGSRGSQRNRSARSSGRSSRRRRISSHDEDEPSPKRSARPARKVQRGNRGPIDRTINIRETRPRTKKNYNEDDSEGDEYHPDIHVQVTVSSRGRVQKRKSYE